MIESVLMPFTLFLALIAFLKYLQYVTLLFNELTQSIRKGEHDDAI